jgi:exodeoxyribonuclease VII small subunit
MPCNNLMRSYNEAMPEENTSSQSFEASLEELERIVKELEKGDLPLERSLALFESGMRLSAECKHQLEEAESRVEILMKRGSEMVPVAFNPEKTGK